MRRTRRRIVGLLVRDGLSGFIAWVTIAVVLAGIGAAVSQRGDLARAGLLAAMIGGATLSLARGLSRAAGRVGTDALTARHVRRWIRAAGTGPSTLKRDLIAAVDHLHALKTDQVHGSRILAELFIARVAATLPAGRAQLRAMLPAPPRRTRRRLLTVALATAAIATATPQWRAGITLAWDGVDRSPMLPPRIPWRDLSLTFDYPAHTHRPANRVDNPTGTLKAPAYSSVTIDFTALDPASHGWIEWAPSLRPEADDHGADRAAWTRTSMRLHDETWTGAFTLRRSGRWRAVLANHDDPDHRRARRSPWQSLRATPDQAPEVTLSRRVTAKSRASDIDRLEIPFTVVDDHGVSSVSLVFQVEGGEINEIPLRDLPSDRARWRHRYTWDLSTIPLERRASLVWWIEARDNDPFAGDNGEPPGNVGRSALQRLDILDEEAAHMANLTRLRDLRDALVDRLAARLETSALDRSASAPTTARVEQFRGMLLATEEVLGVMTTLVDRLSRDARVRPREVAALTAIQRRLLDVLEPQWAALATVPRTPDSGETAPGLDRLVAKLRRAHAKTVATFEDEIIRVDDLVDAEILRRFERLLARLEGSQRRLATLLSQLAEGDETVLPEIELLRARIRQDTAKLNEIRGWLRRSLGEEFMNTEAFAIMLRRMQSLNVDQKIADGDYQGALEQTREALESLRGAESATRDKLGDPDQAPPEMSEEDQAKARLLRDLGRLHDEQEQLEQLTMGVDQRWRASVGEVADTSLQRTLKERGKKILDRLAKVNDARLSRPGRVGYEDAEIALEELAVRLEDETPPRMLELHDQARALRQALETARRGAGEGEREQASLRALGGAAAKMHTLVRRQLPDVFERLAPDDREAVERGRASQAGLRSRTSAVLDNSDAGFLSAEGTQAVRDAVDAMGDAREGLEHPWLDDSATDMGEAKDHLQRAIDSLRNRQPPPPSGASAPDASTEASRGGGLRKAVLDAMRAHDGEDQTSPVSRFYEELLR